MPRTRGINPEEILEPLMTPKGLPDYSLIDGLNSFQLSHNERSRAGTGVEAKPERKGSFESDSV